MWNKTDNQPNNDRLVYICGIHKILGKMGVIGNYSKCSWSCERHGIEPRKWHELPELPELTGEEDGKNKR